MILLGMALMLIRSRWEQTIIETQRRLFRRDMQSPPPVYRLLTFVLPVMFIAMGTLLLIQGGDF